MSGPRVGGHRAPRPPTRLVQVRQRRLDDAALEALGGDLGARGASDERLANLPVGEHRRRLHVIPVLLAERVQPVQTEPGDRDTRVRRSELQERAATGPGRAARQDPGPRAQQADHAARQPAQARSSALDHSARRGSGSAAPQPQKRVAQGDASLRAGLRGRPRPCCPRRLQAGTHVFRLPPLPPLPFEMRLFCSGEPGTRVRGQQTRKQEQQPPGKPLLAAAPASRHTERTRGRTTHLADRHLGDLASASAQPGRV